MIELVVAVSAASMLLLAAATAVLPWLGDADSPTAAAADIEVFLGLARAEAVRRDHVCRFILDPANHYVAVYDTRGTADPSDDEELYRQAWDSPLVFARPDAGPSLSMPMLEQGPQYQLLFTPRSGVPTGTSELTLAAGDGFRRIRVRSTGEIDVDQWSRNAWRPLG